MEDENIVFGPMTEDTENFEEEFSFSCKNKETSKAAIDKSAKEFADFMISVSADGPELSEEEINRGVERILEKVYPADEAVEPLKNKKLKKVTLRVLFIAALLSAIIFSSVCVIGNSNNISIENGFISFAKDTIKIVFFGEENDQYISVDSLLHSLEEHGYDDILFPEEFVTRSDEYKVTVPEFKSDVLTGITFYIYNDTARYFFCIYKYGTQRPNEFLNVKNAQTEKINGIDMYVLEFENGTSLEFVCDSYQYYIASDISYDDMITLAESMKSIKDIG